MNTKNISEKHYGYVDFIRVFSMVMVILLHCFYMYYNDIGNAGKSFWFILSFVNELTRTGVPLFFMISGFLLLSNDIPDIKNFYKKRFSKILVPFLAYDVFYYLFFAYANKTPVSIVNFLKELINNGSAYHLWFIYSICFLYLMVPFVKMIVDKSSAKMLVLFLFVVIFQTTIRPFINTVGSGHFYLYLTEDGVCGYLGYMILGYILGKYKLSAKGKIIVYLLGAASFIIIPAVSMHHAITNGNFLFHGGYSINHYLEASAIFLLCKCVIKKDSKIISSMSKITFSVYFIHVFVLEVLKMYDWGTSPSSRTLLWFVITLVLSFLWGFTAKKITGIFKAVIKNIKKVNNSNSDNQHIS